MGFHGNLPSGKRLRNELETHQLFHGKTHVISTGPFSIARLEITRGYLLGIVSFHLNLGSFLRMVNDMKIHPQTTTNDAS